MQFLGLQCCAGDLPCQEAQALLNDWHQEFDFKIGVRFSQNKESQIYNFVRCKFSQRILFRVQLMLENHWVIFWVSWRLGIAIIGIKIPLINEKLVFKIDHWKNKLIVRDTRSKHCLYRSTRVHDAHVQRSWQTKPSCIPVKKCKLFISYVGFCDKNLLQIRSHPQPHLNPPQWRYP